MFLGFHWSLVLRFFLDTGSICLHDTLGDLKTAAQWQSSVMSRIEIVDVLSFKSWLNQPLHFEASLP